MDSTETKTQATTTKLPSSKPYTTGISMASAAKAAVFGTGAALLAYSLPSFLSGITLPAPLGLASFIGDFPIPDFPFAFPFLRNNDSNNQTSFLLNTTDSTPVPFTCDPTHSYRTEIISLDPLLIYIHSLLTPQEITTLLAVADPLFRPSTVTKGGRLHQTKDRTSSSAGLPRDDPAVQCVLARARKFMGTMLRDGYDEIGPPQLVRYKTGERFNMHHDWFPTPRWATDGSDRTWNRVASFFAILEDRCEGGETHFPYVNLEKLKEEAVVAGKDGEKEGEEKEVEKERPLWREHENGGIAFRPVAGNAIFWVNLHANGTGDERTNHAGLPLDSGSKTAMNIWPRKYEAYE